MKKKLFVLGAMLACMSISLFAQIKPGTLLLDASTTFGSESKKSASLSVNNLNSTSIQLVPDLAYFINENWLVGINSELDYSEFYLDQFTLFGLSSSEDLTIKFTESTISPFIRYYHTLNQKNYLFAGVHFNFNLSNNSFPITPTTTDAVKKQFFSFRLEVGHNVFFRPTFALASSISYNPFITQIGGSKLSFLTLNSKELRFHSKTQNFLVQNNQRDKINKTALYKGNKIFAGELQFSIARNEDLFSFEIDRVNSSQVTIFQLKANAKLMHFITDQLAFGGDVDISTAKLKDVIDNKIITVAPFVRYYFPINELLHVYPTAGFSVSNIFTFSIDETLQNWSYHGGVGVGYFLTNNMAIEANVLYQYDKGESDNTFLKDVTTGNIKTIHENEFKKRSINLELKTQYYFN